MYNEQANCLCKTRLRRSICVREYGYFLEIMCGEIKCWSLWRFDTIFTPVVLHQTAIGPAEGLAFLHAAGQELWDHNFCSEIKFNNQGNTLIYKLQKFIKTQYRLG